MTETESAYRKAPGLSSSTVALLTLLHNTVGELFDQKILGLLYFGDDLLGQGFIIDRVLDSVGLGGLDPVELQFQIDNQILFLDPLPIVDADDSL